MSYGVFSNAIFLILIYKLNIVVGLFFYFFKRFRVEELKLDYGNILSELLEYPLVTHDPNMLKKSHEGT